jgi:hypothetical protein
MRVPYIITSSNITANVNGKAYTVASTHANFAAIREMIVSDSNDIEALVNLFDISVAVKKYCGNRIEVSHGAVKYKGEAMHNYVTDKILQFMREGLPVTPIVNFLDRLLANPSKRAVEELYKFLEHKNMPLTPEGYFLAYKGVRADYRDKHTGKFRNAVGDVLSMARRDVCDDADIGCSYGFHAGSLKYANDWAGTDGHLMIVQIDPADVVSVPKDCNCQKLRTCKYEVVGEQIDRSALSDSYTDAYSDDDYDSDDVNQDDFDDVPSYDYQEGYDDGYADGMNDAQNGARFDNNDRYDTSDYGVGYHKGYSKGYNENK